MAGPRTLLRVAHGSHLYGTAHAGSDWDFYEVLEPSGSGNPWTTRYGTSEQAFCGREDVVRKDLGQWMREVAAGVPQACEAAWARPEMAGVDLIRPLRFGLRVGSAGWPAHRRAMRNFATGYGARTEEYAAKRARHAVRIALNLRDLRERGRYDPTMAADRADYCRKVADGLGPGEALLFHCDWLSLGDTIEYDD